MTEDRIDNSNRVKKDSSYGIGDLVRDRIGGGELEFRAATNLDRLRIAADILSKLPIDECPQIQGESGISYYLRLLEYEPLSFRLEAIFVHDD